MAKFFVLVFIPDNIEQSSIPKYLEEFFSPYSAEFSFPPYKSPCHCVDIYERVKHADKTIGHFHQFWRSYSLIQPSQRPAWDEYIQAWIAATLEPQFNSPLTDKTCYQCKGLGVYTATTCYSSIYDYWVGVKGEILGYPSHLTPLREAHDLPNGKVLKTFKLAHPLFKPFDYHHIVIPDGRPYGRWDYSSIDEWGMIWESIANDWATSLVVRCLVHQ